MFSVDVRWISTFNNSNEVISDNESEQTKDDDIMEQVLNAAFGDAHNSQVEVGSEDSEQVIADQHLPEQGQHPPLQGQHLPQQGNRIPQPPDVALFHANLRDPMEAVDFLISKVLYNILLLEEQFEYDDWLAAQCGCPVSEEWRKQMYLAVSKNRRARPETYRDEWEDDHLVLQAHEDFKKYTLNG